MQIVIDISEDDYHNIKNYTGFLAYYEYLIFMRKAKKVSK